MNIRKRVHGILGETDHVLPNAEITAKVLEELTPDQYVSALTQALPYLVADVVKSTHTTLPLTPKTPAEHVAQQSSGSGPKKKQAHQPSWFVTGVQEKWLNKELDQIYRTGSGAKKLRFCTYEDIVYIADGLREQAKNNLTRADRFDALAQTMSVKGSKMLGNLDVDDIKDVLESDAA